MRVIRDTPLRTESRATVLAQAGLVLAAVILLCGLGASVLLMRVSQDPRLQYPGPVQEATGTGEDLRMRGQAGGWRLPG